MKKFILSAPSYVLFASIKENCLFLKNFVSDVYLALFELHSCLNYTEEDLPPDLAEIGLTYHVHLPLDLNWEQADTTSKELLKLVQKVNFLQPRCFVLHPPPLARDLKVFVLSWLEAGYLASSLCLENIQGRNLEDYWQVIEEFDLSICLDIGHLLAYKQHNILALPGFWPRVKVVHLYGQEKAGKHTSLEDLPASGWQILQEVFFRLENKILVLELFNRQDFLSSYQLLLDKKEDLGVCFV